jgi:hypothetical protein
MCGGNACVYDEYVGCGGNFERKIRRGKEEQGAWDL